MARSILSIAPVVSLALLMMVLPAVGETVTKTYEVKGFHCPRCARSVETVLKEMKGVEEAKADYAEGKVDVSFDDDVVTAEEIEKAIEETGFSIDKPNRSTSRGKGRNDEELSQR